MLRRHRDASPIGRTQDGALADVENYDSKHGTSNNYTLAARALCCDNLGDIGIEWRRRKAKPT
jgi:hypothetical protein